MFTNFIENLLFFPKPTFEQNLKSHMNQILVRWIFLRPSFSLAAETKKGHRFVDLSHQLKKFFPMHLGCKNSKQLRTDSSFKRVSFVDSLKHSKCSDSHGKIKKFLLDLTLPLTLFAENAPR